MDAEASVDLYWLPLGAGGHSVRLNGRVYESWWPRMPRGGRPSTSTTPRSWFACPAGRFVIEQAPVRDGNGRERGVVSEGPVASRWAGRWRIFRYEVRLLARRLDTGRRRGGRQPAATNERSSCGTPAARARAAGADADVGTRRVLRGGDVELELAESPGSLSAAGSRLASIRPPAGGRAPGWNAGVTVARRRSLLADASCDPPEDA